MTEPVHRRASMPASKRGALLRRLGRDGGGASAVEFALVLPLMVTLYFGSIEISDGIIADRKATSMTSAVGDLVAQSSVISDQEITAIFAAANTMMAPYDSTPIQLVVSSVLIDDDGNGVVQWSDASENATPRGTCSDMTLPAAFQVSGTYLVVVEGKYSYTPLIGYIVDEEIEFEDVFYLRPRLSAQVERDPPPSNTC